jgi:hypothetical protein
MSNTNEDLILTAASESYGRQLLAFLGALQCNWPGHPPVRVYDLGLAEATKQTVSRAGFTVVDVPAFVEHWRKHYTWKLWCMNEAPGNRILWLDAGCCVLRPLPEVFEIISAVGYFCVPNYEKLEIEASEAACEGCGVSPDFRRGKVSLAANVFGFARDSRAADTVRECLTVAKTERFIAATHPRHRHDQAILSLMMYRDNAPLLIGDGTIYAYDSLKADFRTQGIWAMRRNMHYKDVKHFVSALETGACQPHTPGNSHRVEWWFLILQNGKVIINALTEAFRGGRKAISNGVKT